MSLTCEWCKRGECSQCVDNPDCQHDHQMPDVPPGVDEASPEWQALQQGLMEESIPPPWRTPQ